MGFCFLVSGDSLESTKSSLAQSEQQLVAETARARELSQKLGDAEQSVATLQGQLTQADSERRSQADAHRDQVAKLEADLAESRQACSDAQAQLTAAAIKATGLESELRAKTVQVTTLEEQLVAARAQLTSASEAATQSNARIAELQTEVQAAEAETQRVNSQAQSQREALEAKLQIAGVDLLAAQQQLQQLQARLDSERTDWHNQERELQAAVEHNKKQV